MSTMNPLPARDAGKAAWRAWARAVRRDGDAEAIARRSEAIVEHLRRWDALVAARHVLVYLPMPGEPDLRALLRDEGRTWYVTRTWPEPERPLTVHVHAPDALESHPYGFRQPMATAMRIEPSTLDLVLVPGLAFDAAGTRLGHGGGYYDRLLAKLRPDAVRVGVAAEDTLVPRLPRERHDVPMDYLATDAGVRAVARPGEPPGGAAAR